jgi:hypothetical protein
VLLKLLMLLKLLGSLEAAPDVAFRANMPRDSGLKDERFRVIYLGIPGYIPRDSG